MTLTAIQNGVTPFRIIVADPLHPSGNEILKTASDVIVTGPYPDRAALMRDLVGADALIVRSATRVDAELLAAGNRLQVIARAGAGLTNIDLDEATRLGIIVISSPQAGVTAVVEHTFAMLLSLARQLQQAAQSLQGGRWLRHELIGFELSGKTLGLIGFGRTGREVAARAAAFRMKVLAYDPYVSRLTAQSLGVEMIDLSELLVRADVISLHTACTPENYHLIDQSALQQMKPGVVLLNCADGGLVDESALLTAIDRGIVAAAGLDTFESEPIAPDSPLLHHSSILAVPHLNQNTVEAQTLTSVEVVQDTLDALRKSDFRRAANLPFNDKIPFLPARATLNLASKLGKLLGQLAEGWITQVEVEVLSDRMEDYIRPVAAMLLSGMIIPIDNRPVNWVSAPMIAAEQGIQMTQVKGLVQQQDYPNLIACRVAWDRPGGESGSCIAAGVLFANGSARLVQFNNFEVDAYPDGYVLILENNDVPGVIGKVGTRLGRAGINIAQWRYGRDRRGGRAVSFINLDERVPKSILSELEQEPEIQRARLVRI
jgi:D-3-phosphoglycerate dehydrogenase